MSTSTCLRDRREDTPGLVQHEEPSVRFSGARESPLLPASEPTTCFIWKKKVLCNDWHETKIRKFFYLLVKHATGTSVWGFQGKFFLLPAVATAHVMHVDFKTKLEWKEK